MNPFSSFFAFAKCQMQFVGFFFTNANHCQHHEHSTTFVVLLVGEVFLSLNVPVFCGVSFTHESVPHFLQLIVFGQLEIEAVTEFDALFLDVDTRHQCFTPQFKTGITHFVF